MNKPPPHPETTARFPLILRVWGQFRSGKIAEWPSADRCLFISVIVFALYLYAAVLATYLSMTTNLPAFFDPAGVKFLSQGAYSAVGFWALLALVSLVGQRRRSDSAWFLHLPVQLWALSGAFFAYLLGPVTTPFFPFALLIFYSFDSMMGKVQLVDDSPALDGAAREVSELASQPATGEGFDF